MNAHSEPLVSVVIPTYARANYVIEALRSALAQTYRNLEILVLDDASPDNTAELLENFRMDPRVHYVRHRTNLGIGGNWRYGISAARGEYFCLLHDDDTLEPDFLEALIPPLAGNVSLALAFSEHSVISSDGAPLPSEELSARFCRDKLNAGLMTDSAFAQAVLVDYSIPVGATLFRRSGVDPKFIDESAKGAIDYWLLYNILKTGSGAFYVNRRLMNYRAHAGGMSSSSSLYMAEGHLFRFDAILNDPQFSAWHPQVAAKRHHTLTIYGLDLLQAGRTVEARQALRIVLRERLSLRGFVAFLLACGGPLGRSILAWLRWLTSRARC